MPADRIVLAYSGDADAAMASLESRDHAEIVTVTVDLGEARVLEAVRDRALAAGAVRAHVLDLREELLRDYVLPALKADVLGGDRYPTRALRRPLMARALVSIAEIEGATAVAHGYADDDPDREPIEAEIRALAPALRLVALEAPEATKVQRVTLTSPPVGGCPDEAVYGEVAFVEVTFDAGGPVAINGVSMPLLELVASLRALAAVHGVGRMGVLPPGVTGMGSTEIREASAVLVLHRAHRALQRRVISDDLDRECRSVSRQYGDIIDRGQWFTPQRSALDAFVASVQQRVTGVIRLKFFQGDCAEVLE